MYYYAQLNEKDICVAVSQLSGEVNQDNMVLIEYYNSDYLGKKYENGVFIEVPKTIKTLLEELKKEYLLRIQEADLLGDTEEKTRLQQEYIQKKAEIKAE